MGTPRLKPDLEEPIPDYVKGLDPAEMLWLGMFQEDKELQSLSIEAVQMQLKERGFSAEFIKAYTMSRVEGWPRESRLARRERSLHPR